MLRFSLSGGFLVLEVVQSTASYLSTENRALAGWTLALAVLSVMPEITRRANAFFTAGEPDTAT